MKTKFNIGQKIWFMEFTGPFGYGQTLLKRNSMRVSHISINKFGTVKYAEGEKWCDERNAETSCALVSQRIREYKAKMGWK